MQQIAANILNDVDTRGNLVEPAAERELDIALRLDDGRLWKRVAHDPRFESAWRNRRVRERRRRAAAVRVDRALASSGRSQPATSPGPLAVSAIRIEDARDEIGRARACDVRRERNPAAVRQHDGSLGKLVFAILIALDVNVGANSIEQHLGRALAETRRPRRRCAARAKPAARCGKGTIGLASPLMRRTDSSSFNPTISASPCARAHAKYSTWPA